MPLPAALRALGHRDFRLFWTGQLVSLVGTWMQSMGQSWLVLELTGSPFRLGLVSALQFTPILLLSLPAGAVADRLPKRRVLLATQTALLLQALALAALVWSGRVAYWHVALLALVFGVVTTLDMPARQSYVVELVGKDDLVNAIALNSAVFNAARIVGPAAAGLLVARYGVAAAFLLNGLSFVAVILALAAIPAGGAPRPRHATMGEEIRVGLRYAVTTPRVALVLGLVLAVSVFVLNYGVLVPLLARDVLHQDADGFGFLMSALGGGALAGALALAALGRGRPPLMALFVPAAAMAVATAALAAVRQFAVAVPVLVIVGFAQIVFLGTSNTILQVTAPDALRGRVMSLYALVFAGVTPIGSLFFGALSEAVGVPFACLTGGGLGLATVLALLAAWRRTAAARFPELASAPDQG